MITLIGGVPRSGKTILARAISRERRTSVLHLDTLRTMFEGAMPGLGISNGNEPNVNAERMWPFVKVFAAAALQDGEDYIVEGSDLLPQLVRELLPAAHMQVVFLGYATAAVDAKVGAIRAHPSRAEWTADMSSAELRALVMSDIERSRYLQEQCADCGIPYYELSADFTSGIKAVAEKLLG